MMTEDTDRAPLTGRAIYARNLLVHLHHPGNAYTTDCVVWCGAPCGSRETTAYRNLDPERVTCPTCLSESRLNA